ncbi:MAG: hypothetical protein QOG65_2664, partial [Actinomycetota bacterium]|nr:hypothetical protein [Actinomycetota bacterium]
RCRFEGSVAGRVVRIHPLSPVSPELPVGVLFDRTLPARGGRALYQLEEISEIVAPPMVAGKPRFRASPNAMIEPLPVAIQ